MRKIKIAYLLLGIGIGIILINGLFLLYPDIKYINLSDEMIIEKAKELGYVSIKESLTEDEETEKKIESEETKKEEIETIEIKEEEKNEDQKIIEIKIEMGDNLSDIAKKLFDAELIGNIEEFKLLARETGVDKKLSYGVFDIKYDSSYIDIINVLIK